MDTLIPTAAELAGDPAIVSRAESLRPVVEAASNDVEDGRRLPPALLDRLHDAKLFRLLLPRSNDGVETDPVTFFHVIETISRGDASTAWCLSQAGGCAMTAAYLAPEVAHDIFGRDPRAVLAWGPGPRVKAIECEGGYKVTGTWAFASGGRIQILKTLAPMANHRGRKGLPHRFADFDRAGDKQFDVRHSWGR